MNDGKGRKMEPIDFVITWVDGNDPAWQEEKNRYSPHAGGDMSARRYRDWDNLQYWFRGVEKFAPWVHKVYFVTWGHIPPWLNTDDPRLQIVKHTDFIPEKYLPTFSSRAIELNMHRIPGLSEQFVVFNDDFFLLAPVRETDFFRDGLPCAEAALDVNCVITRTSGGKKIPLHSLYTAMICNTILINRNFSMRSSLSRHWKKWFCPRYGKDLFKTLLLLPWWQFPGFRYEHLPYSFLKSTFERVWAEEPEMLENASAHRFRRTTDVSTPVITLWQIAEGSFSPRSRSFGEYLCINGNERNDRKICEVIRGGRKKVVCVNDSCPDELFEERKRMLNECFEKVFPEKSGFEK